MDVGGEDEIQVPQGGGPWDQWSVLERAADPIRRDLPAAFVRPGEPQRDPDEGGLADPGRPRDARHIAPGQPEGEVVDHPFSSDRFADSLEFKHVSQSAPPP